MAAQKKPTRQLAVLEKASAKAGEATERHEKLLDPSVERRGPGRPRTRPDRARGDKTY